jgi:hypothetical protein
VILIREMDDFQSHKTLLPNNTLVILNLNRWFICDFVIKAMKKTTYCSYIYF